MKKSKYIIRFPTISIKELCCPSWGASGSKNMDARILQRRLTNAIAAADPSVPRCRVAGRVNQVISIALQRNCASNYLEYRYTTLSKPGSNQLAVPEAGGADWDEDESEEGVHVAQLGGLFATPAARPGGRGGQVPVAAGGPLAAVPEWEDVIMAGCGGPGEQPEGVPEGGACAARRGLRWEGELGDIEMVGGASGAAQGALLRSLAVSESVDVSAQGSAVATFD